MRDFSEWAFCCINFVVTGLLCFWVIGCAPGQKEHIKKTAWSTLDCGLHSTLGCAGQAAGSCDLPSISGDWLSYAKCVSTASQSCVTKSLSRCAFSGMAAVVKGPIVGGSAGCGGDEKVEQVELCVESKGIENQFDAIEASSDCWMKVCGF